MRTLTLLCCVICIVAAGVGYWQPASAIAAAVFRVCFGATGGEGGDECGGAALSDLAESIEILRWGSARKDGASASLTPAQCAAVLDVLRRWGEHELQLVRDITGQPPTEPEGTPV